MRNFWRSPLKKNVLLHIGFWCIVNICLSIYIFLSIEALASIFPLPKTLKFIDMFVFALCLSIFHGSVLGILDFQINRLFLVGRSFSRVITFQATISIFVFVVTFLIFMGIASHPMFSNGDVIIRFRNKTWASLFYVLLFQYSFSSLLVTFSAQIVKKYGRDIFLPMLLGVYRTPREEERIFMFLDLKSSTTLAEELGHLKYSRFVQEFIMDVNRCLDAYHANVYQYAGDEVILTWNAKNMKSNVCIEFFFACEMVINSRRTFYMDTFGVVPAFKAGVDSGKVTAVEIGDIKRDIAYHGDTINTAARIQGLCNSTNQKLLISRSIMNNLVADIGFGVESIGSFNLKGKKTPTHLYSVSNQIWIDGKV